MFIAVVVPAFNVAPWIGRAIGSVIDQTHHDLSLVVVDDGSTDGTAAIASGIRDPRVTLIRQANAGVSSARNRGIAHFCSPARYNFPARAGRLPDAFLFLDGDDWLALDALSSFADALESAPCAVAASGRYVRVGANGDARLSRPGPQGDLLERLMIRNVFANGGHLVIRRQAVEAAGDFRGDLSFGEDWEYWSRLALLGGFAAVASPSPVLFVRERPGSAYLRRATDPAAYRPAIDAIHGNPEIAGRLGSDRLRYLRRRVDAEAAWTIGRELIRHGERRVGQHWLGRSMRIAPSLKRLALMGMSCLGSGPFKPYPLVA